MPSGQSGAVVTDVDPYERFGPRLRPGDVILSVNGRPVASAADAGRELQKVASGRIAQILVWRDQNERVRDGQEGLKSRGIARSMQIARLHD